MEFQQAMNKRTSSLLVLVVLASLFSFGSESQRTSTVTAASKRAAAAKSSARKKAPVPPPSNIGFLSGSQIPAGGYANTTYFPPVTGDFDGDGHPDAATVVQTGATTFAISAVLGNGDGTFKPAVLTPTGAVKADPIWAGRIRTGGSVDDIVMGHQANPGTGTPASFEVFLSQGNGTFVSQGLVYLGKTASSHITFGTLFSDVNNSNNLDVVLVDGQFSNVWTALGNGDGTFQKPAAVPFSPAIAPFSAVAFADFNKDGYLDFSAPTASGNVETVFLNNNGTSYTPTALTGTLTCWDTAGDLNGDGYPEIVSSNGNCATGNTLANTVTVYVNNGASNPGTFQPGVDYPAIGGPQSVAIADVNGDGKADVITTDSLAGDLAVLLGNGDGTLASTAPSVGYALGGAPFTPALVADFNGDGKPDLMVSDRRLSFVYLQGLGDGKFRSAIDYYAEPSGSGFSPNGVDIASGDFNGDGIPDFVIGNDKVLKSTGFSGITIFLSNPDGSMNPGVNYSPATGTFALDYVTVADFNGDGILDIAADDTVNGVVQVFFGTGAGGKGDGKFAPPISYATGTATGRSALALVAGDFNGDGKPDIAVVNNYGATADVGILLNTGGGVFGTATNFALSGIATTITTADLNGDKKLDLIVPIPSTNNVALLFGNGDGTFKEPETDVAIGFNNPFYATVGDLNGDGFPDLAVTIQDSTSSANRGIAVALGNGDGTFQAATLVPATVQDTTFVAPLPEYVKTVDLNRDGHLDLVFTDSGHGTVSVSYGAGDGKTFSDPVEYAASHQTYGLALADVNADGVVDVGTTGNFSFGFSGVTVLLNTSGDSTTVQSSNPHSTLGASVTFTATVAGSKVVGVTAVPTGTVNFFDGTTKLNSSPVALNAGVATFGTSTLATGSHNITAQYSGDLNYVPNTSAVLVQVVGQAASATGTPTSSANPAAQGQSVTFSVLVTSTVIGDKTIPTGKVTFVDGTTTLGSGTLDATGKGSFLKSSLTIGTHLITAQYAGDANFTASKSTTALSQMITVASQPDYTLKATPSTNTVNPGSSASYTISLTTTNGYNGTVTISCPSSLPSGVTCNSPTVTVGTAGTLTITTTAPTAALMAAPDVNQHHGNSNFWASLTGVGMLGMVLAGNWKKSNRKALGIMLLVLGLAMIIGLVGCGGGSSSGGGGGGGGGGGTPAGTYTIQATGTGTAGTNGGNTSSHPIPVTLVVN
jgi:hypothetical protein